MQRTRWSVASIPTAGSIMSDHSDRTRSCLQASGLLWARPGVGFCLSKRRSTMTRVWFGMLAALLLTAPAGALWRSEGPFIGAVVDVAIDPANADTIYAATGSGGVWRSDDGGQHWILPGDGMVNRPVEWIVVDPATPATIWAGVNNTGHAGLWRSLDRGKNWASVRPDKTSYILGQPIAFAPSNP